MVEKEFGEKKGFWAHQVSNLASGLHILQLVNDKGSPYPQGFWRVETGVGVRVDLLVPRGYP